LPDSNINEAASHGFVKFKISQKPNVPHGNYIQNQASIFFDFNPAVLTNLVKLHVGQPDATGERRELHEVIAYPNPFENSTRLKISGLDGQALRLRLFDARGALQRETEFLAPEIEVKREGLASGFYFFSIEKEGEQVGSGKLILR
ncbi:MAG: T9SS type A sorting domain-containing protein, partial [Bacteroidota bacterium]